MEKFLLVASGGYPNDMDSSDVLIHSGQGGKPMGGEKHKQAEDQKLEHGNLALKNGMDAGSPVRVIHGFKETNSSDSAELRVEKNSKPARLSLKEVNKSKKSKVREGLCVVDISQGKEKMPIGAVNTIDDEKPPPFTYITKMIYSDWYKPIPPTGCDCTKGCLNSPTCSCAAVELISPLT
ncbi:histone-lysine N-methyltransferase, H3 lysine-9 specific SUVH5-like [Macadamia integrifolia]|uniref:histone-lysine N-methyltransferase, H3 lysine-9 specific SUVH5-like n=1 Tax=Macadamia integrifolia TaxID=60698 RepID=UPI001C4F9430|nr:histone-lysine N-methyltransferase, H3 lysine-9 specific SUVH5-like [Macadamia integrifolia]